MSVKIRLRRVGAKKQPSYRVVVADSHSPRDGRFIEIIGFYNPRTKPTTITIDAEKARKWLGHGAQPTESVASLLYRAGIVDMRSDRYRQSGKAGAEPPAVVMADVAQEIAVAGAAPEPATAALTLEPAAPVETAPEPDAPEAAPAESAPEPAPAPDA